MLLKTIVQECMNYYKRTDSCNGRCYFYHGFCLFQSLKSIVNTLLNMILATYLIVRLNY